MDNERLEALKERLVGEIKSQKLNGEEAALVLKHEGLNISEAESILRSLNFFVVSNSQKGILSVTMEEYFGDPHPAVRWVSWHDTEFPNEPE